MNATLLAPRRLQKEDSRKGFRSGVDELNTWFEKFAWENQRNNNAVTYVACTDKRVVGYYALAAGGVSKASVDVHFAMRRPSDIPCIYCSPGSQSMNVQPGKESGWQCYRTLFEEHWQQASPSAQHAFSFIAATPRPTPSICTMWTRSPRQPTRSSSWFP